MCAAAVNVSMPASPFSGLRSWPLSCPLKEAQPAPPATLSSLPRRDRLGLALPTIRPFTPPARLAGSSPLPAVRTYSRYFRLGSVCRMSSIRRPLLLMRNSISLLSRNTPYSNLKDALVGYNGKVRWAIATEMGSSIVEVDPLGKMGYGSGVDRYNDNRCTRCEVNPKAAAISSRFVSSKAELGKWIPRMLKCSALFLMGSTG